MSKSRASKMNGYHKQLSSNRNDVFKVPKGKHSNVIMGRKKK